MSVDAETPEFDFQPGKRADGISFIKTFIYI
jgi:hypothetical protein